MTLTNLFSCLQDRERQKIPSALQKLLESTFFPRSRGGNLGARVGSVSCLGRSCRKRRKLCLLLKMRHHFAPSLANCMLINSRAHTVALFRNYGKYLRPCMVKGMPHPMLTQVQSTKRSIWNGHDSAHMYGRCTMPTTISRSKGAYRTSEQGYRVWLYSGILQTCVESFTWLNECVFGNPCGWEPSFFRVKNP